MGITIIFNFRHIVAQFPYTMAWAMSASMIDIDWLIDDHASCALHERLQLERRSSYPTRATSATMEPALTLANAALDLQISICMFLHPADILAVRKVCLQFTLNRLVV